MDTDEPASEDTIEFALLPDSPDSRRFIELMHFAGGDLSPAAAALDIATRFHESGDWDAAGFLVDSAVVSYCRAFLASSVRSPLDEHIEIPAPFLDIHERIRAYRNTTVAHSQSELSTTWPLVVTLASQPNRRRIWTPTLSQPLPLAIVDEFRALVDAVVEIVESRADALRFSLEERIQPPVVLRRASATESSTAELERDFTARSRRRPLPTRQTIFWSVSTGVPPTDPEAGSTPVIDWIE